jgi:hypothetical protein
MSLFGSREDDPLLQDDPLAPSSDEEGPEEAPTGEKPEGAEPEGGADEAAPSPQDDPAEEESLPPAVSRESGDSVFAPTGSNGEEGESGFFHFEGEDDERVIVRTAREAAAGRLNVLNSALDGGWHLSRIELREDSSSDDSSIECVFVLGRPGGG